MKGPFDWDIMDAVPTLTYLPEDVDIGLEDRAVLGVFNVFSMLAIKKFHI